MINYNDGNEHRARVGEHIEALCNTTLRDFIENTPPIDIAACSDVLGHIAEALAALYVKNWGDVVTLQYNDMTGFIIK